MSNFFVGNTLSKESKSFFFGINTRQIWLLRNVYLANKINENNVDTNTIDSNSENCYKGRTPEIIRSFIAGIHVIKIFCTRVMFCYGSI